MPNFDQTGPQGLGQITGRGLGPCGRGLALRRGFGRGFRRLAIQEPVTLTPQEEKEILEADLKDLKQETTQIEKRLKELKA